MLWLVVAVAKLRSTWNNLRNMGFVFPIMPMFRWIGAACFLELEEPTATSKEGKTHLQTSTVMLELCRRWRTVVCCARVVLWEENPIRYQPASP